MTNPFRRNNNPLTLQMKVDSASGPYHLIIFSNANNHHNICFGLNYYTT